MWKITADIKDGAKIKVTQVRGSAGRNKRTKATLQALGLGRIGKSQEFTVNPALIGMVNKVSHLVTVSQG